MDKQHKTLNLDANQVLRLIENCLPQKDDRLPASEEGNRERLLSLMAEKCQTTAPEGQGPTPLLDQFKTQMLHYSGNSIGELLADPHTSLALIRHLKDRFKEQLRKKS